MASRRASNDETVKEMDGIPVRIALKKLNSCAPANFHLQINFSCFHSINKPGETDSLLDRGFSAPRKSDDLSDSKLKTNDFGIDESRDSDNFVKSLNTNKTNWTKSSPSIMHHTEV